MSDARTINARKVFLAALSECGNVTEAAEKACIGRSTVYEWRDADEAFATEWEKALKLGLDGLEDEARRRAYRGFERPVYQSGQMVGTVREFSDTLMVLLLKGGKPDVYRERWSGEITGKNQGPIDMAYSHYAAMPTSVLDQIEQSALEHVANERDDPDPE